MTILIPLVLLGTIVTTFLLLISKRVQSSTGWSATVTPLASIIGSGFLVSVPLLSGAIGLWAIPAVMALSLLAYLIGGVIRYNIRFVEPALAQGSHEKHAIWASLEGVSNLLLIGAYFVSVAYYLSLLSAFLLRLIGVDGPLAGKIVSTVIVASVAGLGATRGLHGVERAEKFTVALKLSAIAGLVAALVLFGVALPDGYAWGAELTTAHPIDTETVRFLLGLLIIVQGFETSRYMGQMYDAPTRIQAMKRAQILSAVIYLVFFILMIPLFPFFTSQADVAGVVDVVGLVSPLLPIVIAIGAIASQFSAAVADSIGASGLISTSTRGMISTRHGYLLIGAIGCLIIWEAEVVEVVAMASRAFAAYYGLQCVLGAAVARARAETTRSVWYGALALVCAAVVVFGIPSAGG